MLAPEFWKHKTLAEMTASEWEALCDGCGRCCLLKLEDVDSEQVYYTDVACELLDLQSCRCGDYVQRQLKVPDCIKLSLARPDQFEWLPSTCAYRRLWEGDGLAWWHPLVSGDLRSVHRAGISVRGRVVHESQAGHLEDHIVAWPA
jgi:uncharacterized cysteine cluster protein YcgN (CxxCxxCC family)